MDTCINYLTSECAYVSSDERHWITRIRKLAEEYPDKVKIFAEPKANDGCIYATVPVKWVKICPPRKVVMTEEKRKEFSDRMKRTRRNVSE